MSRPAPWLAPGLNEFQRAAAFFPEIGMQGDPADLAEAFRVHAAELVAAAYEAAAQEVDCGCKCRDAVLAAETKVDRWYACAQSTCAAMSARDIRALTPADAKAALEAVRREALKDAAEQFMQMHREHMAYLERDPDNYVSAYYTASIELRALIDNPAQEDET